MNKLMIGAAAAAFAAFGAAGVHAQETAETGPFAASNFSATAGLSTDYRFRGLSFTNEHPEIWGSFDWGYEGFYLGLWASNIEVAGTSVEIDYYGGYANTLGGWLDYDVALAYYTFPGADDDAAEFDYLETWVSLSHTFQGTLEPTVGVFWAWSPDFTGEDDTAHYIKGTLALVLPGGFGMDGWVGYQDVEGDKTTGPDGLSYVDWSIGFTKSLKGFDFDLRYIDTDGDADDYIGKDNADATAVFTISRTF